MKKFYIFFAALAVIFFQSSAQAVSTTTPILSNGEYQVGEGDLEVNFLINPKIVRGPVDNETFDLRLGGNYFMSDVWAPGFEFDFSAGNGTSARLLPNVKAYWPLESRIAPYFQLGFGYAREVGANYAAITLGPGVNYMLSNTVAVGVQLRYDMGLGGTTLHVVQIPFQFAVYFKY